MSYATYPEMPNLVQIEWDGADGEVLVGKVRDGLYWFSTPWFGRSTRNERLITREDLEDFWPPEVLELADAA